MRFSDSTTPLRAIALLLTLIALPAAAPAQTDDRPLKIGVVNLDFVVAQSPAGKALAAELDKFQQEARAEVERLTEDARDLRRRIAEGVNSKSEDELAELQRQYEDVQVKIRRYRDDKQREAQKLQNEGLRRVEQELEPVFVRIRDRGGYDLILNNAPGVVLMAGERVEITQEVLDEVKAGE